MSTSIERDCGHSWEHSDPCHSLEVSIPESGMSISEVVAASVLKVETRVDSCGACSCAVQVVRLHHQFGFVDSRSFLLQMTMTPRLEDLPHELVIRVYRKSRPLVDGRIAFDANPVILEESLDLPASALVSTCWAVWL